MQNAIDRCPQLKGRNTTVYRQTLSRDVPAQRNSWVDAEITKTTVHTLITMKISCASMLAAICERRPGADMDGVTTALGMDSRIGAQYLEDARGYGGRCFRRDNVLRWRDSSAHRRISRKPPMPSITGRQTA
jgi:UDP-glucose 6-dehydrogenase